MCSPSWNSKLIAVSCALAAAGVLACAVAILDVFTPKESLAGFLTNMALLALVVTAVVIGYTWVCDRCERYFSGRLDRFRRGGKRQSRALDPYDPTLGGSVSPKDAATPTTARVRHGQ